MSNNNYREYLEAYKALTRSIEILESIHDTELSESIKLLREKIDMDKITEDMVKSLRTNL